MTAEIKDTDSVYYMIPGTKRGTWRIVALMSGLNAKVISARRKDDVYGKDYRFVRAD